jgi:hypothetical protein
MTEASATGNGTPATAPSGSAALSAPLNSDPTAWYSGLDADLVGWAENRGLTKLDAAAAAAAATKGHFNSEKYMGVPAERLVKIPDWDKADQVEIDQYYTKNGRPSTPQEYKIPVPEGAPKEFADFAAGMFHKAGLSARQAEQVATMWNDYATIASAQHAEQQKANIASQEAALRREWGHAYEKNDFLAGEAIRKLGWEDSKLKALTAAVGFDTAMKLFADIGSKIGEDTYVSGGKPPSGPMTPAQAQSRIKQLMSDKEFAAKYLNGNAEARNEMNRLHEMLSGG